jgi:hypothetical protein
MTKHPLPNSKIHQILWGGILNAKEQLSFCGEIQIPNGFWIKMSGSKQHLNLVWIFRGLKPLEKKLTNSSKFYLEMIFMNVNLFGLTCMKNFEDTIQLAFELDLINKEGFEFEYELELGLQWSSTVTTL